MSTYRDWQPTLHPTALRGTWGTAWAASLGAEKDALLSLAKEAVTARLIGAAPSDALDLIGADRDLERGRSEGDASWRDRIAGAWESWSWLGTRYGIGAAVGLLGYGHPAVISWRSLPWDTNATRWARLRIAFRGRASWVGTPWGSWAWGARVVQPIETADAATARAQLRRVLRKWINARDRVEVVQIDRGGFLWGRFRWGAAPYSTTVATYWGAPAWGSSEAAWGRFAWGAFC